MPDFAAISQSNIEPKENLDKHDVLHLLDCEIERITSEQARPGWTLWAIIGSLVGVLWLTFSVWETGLLQADIILPLYIITSMLLDTVISLRSLNSKMPKRIDAPLRYSIGYPSAESRLELVFHIARYIGFLAIVFLYSSAIWWPKVLIVSAACVSVIAIMTLLLIVSFFRVPLPTSLPRMPFINAVIAVSFLGTLIWGLSGYTSVALASLQKTDISNLRMAGLLVTASYLVWLLARGVKTQPLLISLIEIRRDLSLNRIDVNTAVRQTEIALAGMQVADFVQQDISMMLKIIEQVNSHYISIMQEIDSLKTSLPSTTDMFSEGQKRSVLDACNSCRQHIEAATFLQKRLEERMLKGKKLIKYYTSQSSEAVFPLLDVLKKVHLAIQDSGAKQLHYKQKVQWLGNLKNSFKVNNDESVSRN